MICITSKVAERTFSSAIGVAVFLAFSPLGVKSGCLVLILAKASFNSAINRTQRVTVAHKFKFKLLRVCGECLGIGRR
jgi:hypothetical protein